MPFIAYLCSLLQEALRIFKKALEMFSSSDKGPNATTVLAECLYNLGLCYMEEGNLQMVSVCLDAEIICCFHAGRLHQFCF